MFAKRPLRSIALLSSCLAACLALAGCATTRSGNADATSTITVSPTDNRLAYSGRRLANGDEGMLLSYSGARVRLRFEGGSIALRMRDASGQNFVKVWIDGEPLAGKIQLAADTENYPLASGLGPGEHTVEVTRLTECFLGPIEFRGFEIAAGKALAWGREATRKIEFIGDSITCGYGVEVDDPNLHFDPATENFSEGYSALAARSLGADYLVVSRSGIGMVRGYDGPYEGSEETMPLIYPYSVYQDTSAKWDFSKFTPDVVCINLGTNDFSTTGVNVEKYVAAYIDFGKGVLQRYPKAKLVVLQGPMENGDALRAALDRVVAALDQAAPGRASYLKLSPQGSVGFGADWHPNRAQSKINAAELETYLKQLMNWQ